VVVGAGQLNLFLHVTGRREDGYHDLQTLFQLIDRCDRIGLAARADGCIRRGQGLPGLAPELDLAVRAAAALQRHTGTPLGADIQVFKHPGRVRGAWRPAVRTPARSCWGLIRFGARPWSLDELARLEWRWGRLCRCLSTGAQLGARAGGNGWPPVMPAGEMVPGEFSSGSWGEAPPKCSRHLN